MRNTHRSRSRRRRPYCSRDSSGSERLQSVSKRRRTVRKYGRSGRSGRRRDSSSSSSSSSPSSSEEESGTSDTTGSSSNSESGSDDRSRRRSRPVGGKRKRPNSRTRSHTKKRPRSSSLGSRKTYDFVEKMTEFFSRKEGAFEGAHKVIPEYDPDANAQTAADWIRKVNQTAAVYGWNNKQIIYYAIPKLAGYAKKWYQTLSSVDLTWHQWQKKILKTFPDDRNYADRLYEMLDRKSKREESLEEYFHDKARLVKMCGLLGRNAVDCIINGIFDNSIRLNAQGSSFKRPSQLLKYLRRISKKTTIQLRKVFQGSRTLDGRPDNSHRFQSLTAPSAMTAPSAGSSKSIRFKYTRCYNCSEMGHTARACTRPVKRCDKCSRLGHISQQCTTPAARLQQQGSNENGVSVNNADTKSVLQISKEGNQNGKYFKCIKLNGIDRSAYVDFGSQCTLIKNKIAEESNIPVNTLNLPTLKGFAFGSVLPLGRASVNIEIDAVKADVDALIVDDKYLTTDVLIGQSLTELPTVSAIKTNDNLVLYCDQSLIERSNVYNSSEISFEGLIDIKVHTDNDLTGLLFIPGCVSMEHEREFCTLQGLYQFTNGRGRVVVINFSGKPLTLSTNKIISRAVRLPNFTCWSTRPETLSVNRIVSANSSNEKSATGTEIISEDMVNVGPKISYQQKKELLNLLNRYRHCFAFSIEDLGLTTITEMSIHLNDDTPVMYKPYRLPYSERKVVREMVGELLANNIIRESHSAYASPIVLVRKKNGDYRLCVDYRALNKKTVKDSYPMPVIEDQLDRLSGKSYFTSLDLASGYYQIPVSESSRHVTAFVTPDGHYEYTRMPFGLVNAPAVFQNMINRALGNRRFDLAVPYLDDLLSACVNLAEGMQKLEEILELLSKAGLTLNLKKCFFFQSEIEYLGYQISEAGLRPGSNKTQAVSEFPRPQNVHQVRQFVGLASFFRRFVCNFAALARPLTKLTKADTAWMWNNEQETAFQDIKTKLVTRPILALYNPDFETEVHCDASKIGIGGVLLQKPGENTPMRPVAYFSRQTTREEEFWHSYELETMAVVFTLQRFRVYLLGLEFKVVTDCNALRSTLTKRDLLPKVARWWLVLQEFNFTIEYRPGHSMQHADALSRNPVLPPNEQEEMTIMQITTKDWLHTVQMTDSRLKQIKIILKTSTEDLKDITNNYVLRDDKLYRRVGKSLKWVVPHGARWRVCQMNHDEAGHFSVDKTLEKISADYWFPKMNRFIKKYVTSCINCAYNKESAGKKTGYLHPIPKPASIFHTIHMDHLGPFVKSKRGNSYILGVIDAFSKFIFVRAVKDTRSKTTIKVLEDIFSTFGCPRIIISDQGTSFTSNEFKNFVKSIGVKHIYNAVATPRANGQIERYNRTILNSLASMNHGLDEKDWDIKVAKLQWSLNNTFNKGIGKSPAEVVFGYRTSSQTENLLKASIMETSEALGDNLETEREEIRKNVQENIEEKQKKMKATFDKTRAPTKVYSEGDLVMIPNHNPEKGKSKKLAPKFRGPFKVTAVLDRDRYEISSISGHSHRQYKNIYPADQLKSWITFQASPSQSIYDSSSDTDAENESVN